MLNYLTVLKNTCDRQAVLDKWFPLSAPGNPAPRNRFFDVDCRDLAPSATEPVTLDFLDFNLKYLVNEKEFLYNKGVAPDQLVEIYRLKQ